jgi:hypothetical protein
VDDSLGAVGCQLATGGELVVLDAAGERRPGGLADDEGEAVGVVAVPDRDPAGGVR